MATNLTDKELSEFREIFDLVDADGSGRITQQELRSLMEVLRLRPTEEELYELFTEAVGTTTTTAAPSAASAGAASVRPTTATGDAVGEPSTRRSSGPAAGAASPHSRTTDPNSEGEPTIDFAQFVTIMSRRVQSEYTPEQLRGAFKLFETEDLPVGVVSTEVLEHALMTYGTEKLSQEEAARLVSAVDPSGTGMINYLDFVALVTGEDTSSGRR